MLSTGLAKSCGETQKRTLGVRPNLTFFSCQFKGHDLTSKLADKRKIREEGVPSPDQGQTLSLCKLILGFKGENKMVYCTMSGFVIVLFGY